MSEFSKAFLKAQQKMGTSPKFDKKAKAGAFTYEYVSLGGVLQHVIPACNDNGISVTQEDVLRDGVQGVKTTLEHISGEKKEFFNPFCGTYTKPQEYGSVFTYTRRYALYGIFSLYGETDTDAAEISSGPSPQPKPTNGSEALVGKIISLTKGDEERQTRVMNYYGVKKFSEMNKEQLLAALEWLEKPQRAMAGV